MLLAYQGFDGFMIAFTILLVIALVRLVMTRPRKNMFAIGFTAVAVIAFIFTDIIMVRHW